MSPSMSRPQTPPPVGGTEQGQLTPPPTAGKQPATPQKRGVNSTNQLLTPPSTGDVPKTVRFAETRGSPTPSKRRRFDRKNDDELALAEYTELDDPTDLSDVSISEDDPIASSPSPEQRIKVTRSSTATDTDDEAQVELAPASVTTSPFPFTKLPTKVRKKIYALLLVVPGLVCVRQNHTTYHTEEKAFLYAEPRLLLPGIAYALPQVTVGGFKVRFAQFCGVNTGILNVSREVYGEARAVLYGGNAFEIVCPNLETSPPADYKVPLFPRGCTRLVRSLSIRVRALYPLKWLLNGGYGEIKDAYRGLETLDVVFEMESATKGVAKMLCKKEGEKWVAYVTRLHTHLNTALFDTPHHLPIWIHLRVLFDGEAYADYAESDPRTIAIDMGPGNASPTDVAEERLRRYHLKRGLPEAFEMCKRGGR